MPVNVNEIAQSLKEPWKPVVAAEANGFQLKAVRGCPSDGDKAVGGFEHAVRQQEER